MRSSTFQQCKSRKAYIHNSLDVLYSDNHPTAITPLPVSLPSQGDTLASVLSIQHTRHLAELHLVDLLFHAHTHTHKQQLTNTYIYMMIYIYI